MLNCAVIMGRLVADPELRTTPNGISVTSFCVAVDRSFVKAGEERKADFINVVAWRQTADFVTRYFHKGSMIAEQGGGNRYEAQQPAAPSYQSGDSGSFSVLPSNDDNDGMPFGGASDEDDGLPF